MDRIYKNTGKLKHQYAFNEYGNVIHIRDAERWSFLKNSERIMGITHQ